MVDSKIEEKDMGRPESASQRPLNPAISRPEIAISKSGTKVENPPQRPTHKKAKIALASLAALATVETLGAVSTETHNEQPVSIQTIPADLAWPKTAVEDFLKGLKGPEAPPMFDNKLDKGVIGANNIARMPQKEIDKQFPTAFEKLNDGKNTLQFEYLFDLSKSTDPSAQLAYVKSFSGLSYAERQQYKNTGIYDTFNFQNIPGGTIIRSPVDGYLVISIDENNPPDLSWGNAWDGFIEFVAPNGNQYSLMIFGSTTKDLQNGTYGNTQTGYIFKSLIDAPIFEVENNKQIKGSYGVKITKGEPILQVIQPPDNDTIGEIGFGVAARKGEVGKPDFGGNPSIPTNVEFLTTPDGKLISPQ